VRNDVTSMASKPRRALLNLAWRRSRGLTFMRVFSPVSLSGRTRREFMARAAIGAVAAEWLTCLSAGGYAE
jgi:hypothetical protein